MNIYIYIYILSQQVSWLFSDQHIRQSGFTGTGDCPVTVKDIGKSTGIESQRS